MTFIFLAGCQPAFYLTVCPGRVLIFHGFLYRLSMEKDGVAKAKACMRSRNPRQGTSESIVPASEVG